MAITKVELIEKMAREACVSKNVAEVAYNALLNGIVDGVKDDGVQLTGFGVFSKKDYEDRDGRNPATGEAIKIGASSTMKFKVSKKVREVLS